MAGRVGWHLADVLGDKFHGISAITVESAILMTAFRSRTVDDGNEVICDDDSVLAFSGWTLRYECLFDDVHKKGVLMDSRQIV